MSAIDLLQKVEEYLHSVNLRLKPIVFETITIPASGTKFYDLKELVTDYDTRDLLSSNIVVKGLDVVVGSPTQNFFVNAEAILTAGIDGEGIVKVHNHHTDSVTAMIRIDYPPVGKAVVTVVVTTTFPNDPTIHTTKYGIEEIPIEFFYSLPKGVLGYEGWFRNRLTFNQDVYDAATVAADTRIYPVTSTSALVVDTSIDGLTVNGTTVSSGGVSFTTSEPTTYLNMRGNYDSTIADSVSNALPAKFELVYPNVCRTTDGIQFAHGVWPEPGAIYAGMRPMAGRTGFVFIDNIGFAGNLECTIAASWDSGAGNPDPTTRNMFTGLLKRSAMGKPVAEISVGDVVVGILIKGSRADFIVNGVSQNHRLDVPTNSSYLQARLVAEPTYDHTVNPQQLNAIELNFHTISTNAGAGDAGSYWSGTYTVDMSQAVVAGVTDMDLRGLGSSPAVNGHCEFFSMFAGYYGNEPIYGTFYQE